MQRTCLALLASTALTLPAVAVAEVTPQDVWANSQAYAAAFGGTLTGNLSPTGRLSGIEGKFPLPMGAGMVTFTMSDMTMLPNGDGTVTVSYPSKTDMHFAVDVPDAAKIDLDLRMTTDGPFDMRASGNPGDVTYVYDVSRYQVELTDISGAGQALDEETKALLNGDAIKASVEITNASGETRVTEGDLLAVAFDSSQGSLRYDFNFSAEGGLMSSQSGQNGQTSASGTFALPAGGFSVLAIPQALRDGLALSVSSKTEGGSSEQVMKIGDEVLQSTKTSFGSNAHTVALDVGGLRMDGTATDYNIEAVQAGLPFPIEVAVQAAAVAFALPVMATVDGPEPLALRLAFDGVQVGDVIWAMADPVGALPHDPADLEIDLKAMVSSEIDLFDVMAMGMLEESDELPFGIHELTLNRLHLAAVGAAVDANGSFELDMNNLDTFDGIPAPTGSVSIMVAGLNGLLDKLTQAGMVPQDQVMGLRMMLGGFTKPGDQPDTLQTTIEVDGATGAVSANGMRIR